MAGTPWLDVMPEGIPLRLRWLSRWVLWRATPSERAKPIKVPYRVDVPTQKASSTNADTWGSFADAVDAYTALVEMPADPTRGPVAGIGFVLTGDGITCLDLDRVLVDGALDPRAAGLVEACSSFTEVSPSRTGLHIFVEGKLAVALKGEQFEAYGTARYIAMTGQRWPGTPESIEPRQALLDRIAALGRDRASAAPRWTGPSAPPPDDLRGALVQKLAEWGLAVRFIKRHLDGYLAELVACPWAHEHTAGGGGAAVMIFASGAFDFTCLHAHCAGRTWRELRAVAATR